MSTMATEINTTQVYQLYIKADPERIWEAITQPDWTQKYFYGSRTSFDLRPGGRLHAVSGDNESQELVEGEVLEADPPRKLVHTWRALYDPELAGEEPSRVTWEIEQGEDGVSLLTVVHDRLEGAPKTAQNVSGTGWMRVLSGLKTVLETGEPLAG
jgi:uncharacterized protein YndB with AHSA1/START domain